MTRRSDNFLKLQRKVTIYMKRKQELHGMDEKLMQEYIELSRKLKAELDLKAAQIEILFHYQGQ